MTPLLTPTMTGLATPDPLRFAFTAKTSAHASRGGGGPLMLDDAGWHAWWQRESEAGERAIYIHIPFCRKRCSFCNFFENGANPARMSRYVAALCDQLSRAAKTPLAQSKPFSAVYVGGGTPTDMAVADLARLGEAIRAFPLTPDAELTLEGRLNGFDDAKWQTALAGGFNRFSFGVQSFDTGVRRQAGRFDDRETLLARLGALTRGDEAVVVTDLIFGLPGQDDAVWRQDIADVMASGVHGVDLYQLIPMAGTNLARAEILPFGAGAGGNVLGHGLMYGRDLAAWHAALAEGVRAPGMVMRPNPDARLDGLLRAALDTGWLVLGRLPSPLRAHLLPLFERWQQHGLAELTGETLVLTLAGRFWNVNLQAGLFEYLQHNPLAGSETTPAHPAQAVRHSLA